MKGILGRKIGMTSMFLASGKQVPVTLIEVQDNVVTKVLTNEKNKYSAIQLAAFDKSEKNTNKPKLGQFKQAKTTPKRFVKEIRNMEGYQIGDKVKVSIFQPGDLIDVTGTSKGKGFAGAIKRWNQTILPMSHGGGGGSKKRRLPGSNGTMAMKRVAKGKHMPGHLGFEKTTIQNLEVITIDEKENLLGVKGSIPGPKKGFVVIRQNAKSLSSIPASELIDLHEMHLKNDLLEEAKHYGTSINTDMSVEEMQKAVDAAKAAKAAQTLVDEITEKISLNNKTIKNNQEKLASLKDEDHSQASDEEKDQAKELLENLTKQIDASKKDQAELKSQLLDAKADFEAKEKASKEMQVVVEKESDEEESK